MCKQHQTTKVQQKEDNVGNHFATIWRRLLKLQLRIQKWANRTKPKRSAEWKQTRETIRQFMLIQSMNRNKLQQLWKTEQTNTEPPPSLPAAPLIQKQKRRGKKKRSHCNSKRDPQDYPQSPELCCYRVSNESNLIAL